MKKISKIQWNNYKNSVSGKKAIADFGKLMDPNATIEEFYELACNYNPEFFKNRSIKEKQEEIGVLNFYDSFVYSIRLSIEKEMNGDEIDYGPLYQFISTILISEDAESKFDDIPQSSFKNYLGANIFFTLILSAYFPKYYIPNFFPMQFVYLKKVAYKYEMELSPIPARADYKGRWMYYDAVCKMLNEFAVENDIQDLSELCAFIYDYEFSLIKEEMEEEHSKPMPAVPEQAWILVGNYGEGEKTMKEGFWQANELTCKGDIMLFYEKSPVKKLNAVWTALDDGVKDPFFHYYSHTYITYAKWGNARVLVICDKNQIRVYERNKKNQFVPYDTPTARFRWEELQVLEKRNELKRLRGKR